MGGFAYQVVVIWQGDNSTHSNLFRSWEQYSVNIEHWLKYKLALPCVYKEYEVQVN